MNQEKRTTTTNSRGPRVRFWCFTENDEQQIQLFRGRFEGRAEWDGNITYCVAQLEKGKESGHTHLQGYVELKKHCFLSQVKSKISPTAHWEIRRGTRDEARIYCRKDDTRIDGPWEYGEWIEGERGQGKRSDLDSVVERIRDGGTIKDVADDFPIEFIKFHRGIREYSAIYQPKRNKEEAHEAILFYGPPGCGKTSWVAQNYTEAYWKPTRTTWFDGYHGENVIIFDDFNSGWFTIDNWCRIVDRYQCQVEIKGGHVQLNNQTSVFTTNTLPSEWYNWEKYGQKRFGALIRRFTKFCAFYENGKFEEFTTYGDFRNFVNDPTTRGREWNWTVLEIEPNGSRKRPREPSQEPIQVQGCEGGEDTSLWEKYKD